MAYTLRESYTPSVSSQFSSLRGANKYQTFTAVSSHSIDKIELQLKKFSSVPSRTVGVYLYSYALGEPNVELAQFGSFDQANLTTDYVTYIFSDASYDVTNGVEYAIVIYANDGSTASEMYWLTNTAAGYADGTSGYSYVAGWVAGAAGDDRWFKCYEISSGAAFDEGTVVVTAAATVSTPGYASSPTPADDAENIVIVGTDSITKLTWEAPTGTAPNYKIYFRAQGGTWALQETTLNTEHTLSTSIRNSLSYYSVYEWRVDTHNASTDALLTTGFTWTFISQVSSGFTDYTRRSDYDADKVWQPGTGWVDINSFNFAGGGQYKEQVVVVGHKVIYFGDV